MKNIDGKSAQIFEKRNPYLKGSMFKNVTCKEKTLSVNSRINSQAGNGNPMLSNFWVRYFPDLQCVRLGITHPDIIPEDKINDMLKRINLVNNTSISETMTLCPLCHRVDSIIAIYLKGRMVRKEHYWLLRNLLLGDVVYKHVLPTILAGERDDVKSVDVNTMNNVPLEPINTNRYERMMAEIKEILEAELQKEVIHNPVEQKYDCSFLVEGNYPVVLDVMVPHEMYTIDLSIRSNDGINYESMETAVMQRLNLLNRQNIVGRFILSAWEDTFILKQDIDLNRERLNKSALRWTLRMLLNQANLYFPAISDGIDSIESPDTWLKKRWTDPSYLHESCK